MATEKKVKTAKRARSLQPVRSITPQEALADVNPSRAPNGVPTARWNAGMPRGRREGKSLAWYRGHHAGIYDAYKTLVFDYPTAAERLLRSFGMNRDGSIG